MISIGTASSTVFDAVGPSPSMVYSVRSCMATRLAAILEELLLPRIVLSRPLSRALMDRPHTSARCFLNRFMFFRIDQGR